MEIERKYKVKELPTNLDEYEMKEIEQGYLCNKPIVRIRKSNEEYYLTYKSKLGVKERKAESPIINNEVELPLTKESYHALKSKIDDNLVCKKRYLIPLADGLMAELDVFEKQLDGLIMVEVEFVSEEQSLSFNAPEWFGSELSSDKRFSNHFLSTLSGYNELGLY